MPSQIAPIRDADEALLLAITPQQDVASGIEMRLRDAGRNVRVDWLEKPEGLKSYLKKHTPTMLCCQAAEKSGDASRKLLSHCFKADPELPAVLLDETGEDARAELMRAGARDVVAPDALEHLTAVLVRELDVTRLHASAKRDRNRSIRLERRLDTLLSESREARATLEEGIHAGLNPTYARMFGFESPEELKGVPLMDLVVPADRDRVKKKLADCRKGKDDGQPIHFTGQRADDSLYEVTMHLRPLSAEGEDAVEILIPQAASDTNAGNNEARAALYHALEQPHLGAGDEVDALCFLTVDDLDGLQERQGLRNAERVVDELGLFLLETVREGDRCFRFGAGEFVILCSRQSEEELAEFADTLRTAIDDELFGDDDVSASLTVSIAATVLENADRDALLLEAIRRARRASAKGGNTVARAAASEHRVSGETSERQWLDLLRRGLREDRFTFAYQSIASLEGSDTEYFDVLLRLIGEQGEILHSRDFIEVARHHGLMRDIDRLTVQKVLKLLSQRRERGAHGMFFVELSDATLDEAPEFLKWLRDRVEESRLGARELGFELTEDSLRSNVRRARQLAEGLKKLDLPLAIEGFGTTGKSIQLLEHITADFAKLDATVTEALAGDESDPAIGEAVQAARERGIRLIAQQVADANTMARLWQAGINYIQGQFVQEPDAETVAEINAA